MFDLKKLKEEWIVLVSFLLLTIILTFPLIFNLSGGVATASGDVWQFVWNFWWFKKALVELNTNPFYTDYIYYPTGTSLLFNLNMPLHSLLSIPLQYFFNLFFIYNIFVIFSFVLSAYGTYLLAKYLTKNKIASFIGGIVFAFSPFMFVRLFAGHLYLMETGFMPFFILFFIKTVKEPKKINALLAVLFLVLILINSLTHFTFIAIFTGLYLVYYLIVSKKTILNKKTLNHISLFFSLFFVLTLPYFFVLGNEYLNVEYKDLHRSIDESEFYSADLAAFFTPISKSLIFGSFTSHIWEENVFTGNWNESSVFIGYTVLVIIIFSFLNNKNKDLNFWKISFVFFLLLSLGPFLYIMGRDTGVPLPYTILFKMPLFDVSRGPSRFIAMVMLSASVVCSYFLAGAKIKFKKIFLMLAAGFVIMENLYVPINISGNWWVSPFYYRMGEEKEDYAYLNLFPHHIADYSYLQTISGKRELMGFVSRHPSYAENFTSSTPIIKQLVYDIPQGRYFEMEERNLKTGFDKLKQYNIRYVIIHKINIKPEIFERYIGFMKELNISKEYEDNKAIVYRVI